MVSWQMSTGVYLLGAYSLEGGDGAVFSTRPAPRRERHRPGAPGPGGPAGHGVDDHGI